MVPEPSYGVSGLVTDGWGGGGETVGARREIGSLNSDTHGCWTLREGTALGDVGGEGLPGGVEPLATVCAMEASCSMSMVGCVVVIMGAADGLFGCLDRGGGGRFVEKVGEGLLERGGGGAWGCFLDCFGGSLFVVSGVGFLSRLFASGMLLFLPLSRHSPALSKSVYLLGLLCLCSCPSGGDLEVGR